MMKIRHQIARNQNLSLQIEDWDRNHFSICHRIMQLNLRRSCRIFWSFKVQGPIWSLPPKLIDQIKRLRDYQGIITNKRAARSDRPCLSYRSCSKRWTLSPMEIGKSILKHQCGVEINKVWRRLLLAGLLCQVWTAWLMWTGMLATFQWTMRSNKSWNQPQGPSTTTKSSTMSMM